MSSFRFIHSADIHLDSPLLGLTGYQGGMIDRIRLATRTAFEQLIEYAIEYKIDFLIIAGDLYDGDWKDYNTGLFFVRQMGRLNDVGIPVFLIQGNHDAESKITRQLELPNNVKVFSASKPESVIIDELEVAIHGQSYKKRDITDNLAVDYPDPVDGFFNIGILHTGLGGKGEHQNYAPCSLSDLINKRYDYWALGHIHQNEVLHTNPHIIFSGNLQGRHIRETGIKGAYIVSIEEGEVVDLSQLECDDVRWFFINVELENCATLTELYDCIKDKLSNTLKFVTNNQLLSCRIKLTGSTQLHQELLISEDKLLVQARSIALGMGDEVAWIEKVIIGTEPIIKSKSLSEAEDVIAELQSMLEAVIDDPDLVEYIKNDISQLINGLPPEIRKNEQDNILKIASEGDYPTLIKTLTPYLFACVLQERSNDEI